MWVKSAVRQRCLCKTYSILTTDAGIGDDDVDGARWGAGDGVFEEGELGGPGEDVGLGVGAIFSLDVVSWNNRWW